MRSKILLLIFLLLFVTIAMTRTSKATLPYFSLDPISPEIPEPGQTFQVNITINEVTNLWAWKVNFTWNPSVLNVTAVEEGPFLSSQASPTAFVVSPYDWTKGCIPEISCGSIKVPAKTASGSGVAAILNVTALAVGYSSMNMTDTIMIGPPPTMTPIAHEVINGEATVIPEFSASTILPLFLIITATATILVKMFTRKRQDHLKIP